ncbi:MAG: polysaccharide biosynthesis/export family protein [Caulobacteraceae bacterium]
MLIASSRRTGCVGPLAGAFLLLAASASEIRAQERALPARAPTESYRIGPLDKLNITVFEVKDLSFEKLQVDASGKILLPLIGPVEAAGRTAPQLSAEIAVRLGARYLQSPQVSVTVAEAVGEKIIVEGAVNQAGVFTMKGRTTLLEAVAMAKGYSRTADVHKVAIVRSVHGAPRAARFDLAAVKSGQSADPEVDGGDVVVVAESRGKTIWRGLVESMPAFNAASSLHNVLTPGGAPVQAPATAQP